MLSLLEEVPRNLSNYRPIRPVLEAASALCTGLAYGSIYIMIQWIPRPWEVAKLRRTRKKDSSSFIVKGQVVEGRFQPDNVYVLFRLLKLITYNL